jgi:hypothetical protein
MIMLGLYLLLSMFFFFFFFSHLNCRIKSWTIQLVLPLDLLVLFLLHLGLVFWILIWVLVLQLWALKILVQLSHQNLKKVSKHQRFGNILPS